MNKIIVILTLIFSFAPLSISCAVCEKTEPLFVIERSMNRNVVHFDACLDKANNLSYTEPVIAYWVLGNGKRENLNQIEKTQAFGINLIGNPRKKYAKFELVSFKERKITVQEIGGRYRALTLINARQSILEKVYIKTKARFSLLPGLPDLPGLPTVIYAQLYGITIADGRHVNERIQNR